VIEELLGDFGDGEPFTFGGRKLLPLFEEPLAVGAIGLRLGFPQVFLDTAGDLEIPGFLGLTIPRFRQRHF
jgi:hypothetical protein